MTSCGANPANGTWSCLGTAPNYSGFTCTLGCTSPGYHVSGSACAVDSQLAQCGTTDVNCNTAGPPANVATVACVPSGGNYACQYTCKDGYHLNTGTNTCDANSATACCGGSGGACGSSCAGPASGTASGFATCSGSGALSAYACGITCNAGYHYNSTANTCDPNSTTACCGGTGGVCGPGCGGNPAHGTWSCNGTAPTYSAFACALSCSSPGYHVSGSACAVDSAVTKCGTGDLDCTVSPQYPANASTNSCDASGTDYVCNYVCKDGYNKNVGPPKTCDSNNTVSCCGGTGGVCGPACAGPVSGPTSGTATCTGSGALSAYACGIACASGYHFTSATSSCDPNNTLACCGGTNGNCAATCATSSFPGSTSVVCTGTGTAYSTYACAPSTCDPAHYLSGGACVASTDVCCGAACYDCTVNGGTCSSTSRCIGGCTCPHCPINTFCDPTSRSSGVCICSQ